MMLPGQASSLASQLPQGPVQAGKNEEGAETGPFFISAYAAIFRGAIPMAAG